jgi:hypothetical protein
LGKWDSGDGLLDGVCVVLRVFDAPDTFVYLPYPCTTEGRERNGSLQTVKII